MSNPTHRPDIQGIHHEKLAVTDLDRSLRSYEIFLGVERIPEADHHKEEDRSLYGYILKVPGLGTMLEPRLDAEQVEKRRFFDQFTVAVKTDRRSRDGRTFSRQTSFPTLRSSPQSRRGSFSSKIRTKTDDGFTRLRSMAGNSSRRKTTLAAGLIRSDRFP